MREIFYFYFKFTCIVSWLFLFKLKLDTSLDCHPASDRSAVLCFLSKEDYCLIYLIVLVFNSKKKFAHAVNTNQLYQSMYINYILNWLFLAWWKERLAENVSSKGTDDSSEEYANFLLDIWAGLCWYFLAQRCTIRKHLILIKN